MKKLHIHSALAFHGGAARVARMIGMGAAQADYAVTFSCEIQDAPDTQSKAETSCAPECATLKPKDVAAMGRHGLLHVHATQDWEGVLTSARNLRTARNLVLTLHDARLLTGGCFHPLSCQSWLEACPGTCVLGYPDTAVHGRNLRELLRFLKPLLVCPSAWLARMTRAALPDCECVIVPNGVEEPIMAFGTEDQTLLGPEFHDTMNKGHCAVPKSLADRLFMLKNLARRRMGIAPSAKVILFAAHGGEKNCAKGGGDWMRIWESVKAAVPECVGIMAGGARFERCGDVLFWPYAGRAAMNHAMLAADVFVQVSLAENHPLVVLEAFAAGVPVCAFAVGGIPEQVVNQECGSLHPYGEYDGLIRSIIGVLRRPALLRKWSFAARQRYERHFTIQRMCADYLKIYERYQANKQSV